MRILYIANDGTEFENEWDCEAYEEAQNHPEITNVVFYDKNNCPYKVGSDLFDDDIYNDCEKVLIHDEKEYEAFQWLARECGWCEFQNQIKSPGLWVRHSEEKTLLEASWERIQ